MHIPERTLHISTQSMINFFLIILVVAGLFYMRSLVYIFLTSIVISSFVESAVRRLKTRGFGRTLSVVLIYFCVVALIGLFFYFFVPLFVDQLAQVSVLFERYMPASHATEPIAGLDGGFNHLVANFQALATNASGGIIQTVLSVFGGVFNFIVLIVLSFYLSLNHRAVETFIRLVAPSHRAEGIVSVWKKTEHKIGLWFQGQLLLALIVGVMIYAGLLFFNIEYALLLAVLAAIMELIPFGIILASIPAIAAGFTSHHSTGALEVAALYFVVHEVDLNFIAPFVVQRMVGISSLVVILSFLIGLNLAGFWGLILAVPVAIAIIEIIDASRKKAPDPEPTANITITVTE